MHESMDVAAKRGMKKQLDRMRTLFAKQRIVELRNESNELIEEAARLNDKVLAEFSLICYALHKLLTKVHITRSTNWQNVKTRMLDAMDKCGMVVDAEEEGLFEKALLQIVKSIQAVDARAGNYVQDLYDKARVKQASRAYGMGLSLGAAAELTGADPKDLQNYIGTTTMHDETKEKYGIANRVRFIKDALGE